MSEPQKNIIETAIEAGKSMLTTMETHNGTPFAVIPKDYEFKTFPELRDNPLRTEQTTKHTTAQSFIDYFNNFANADSVIFIDEINNRFTAVIDYHTPIEAGWKKHISIFELSKTPEWSAWLDNNKKPMIQEEFGLFIENQLPEIIHPSGADMLEIALSLKASTSVKFSQATRLDNGQLQMNYHEEIDGKAGLNGQFKIPEKFTIGLRLFRGGEPYQMEARLRYRIKDGNLSLWYELIRPHAVIDANINDTTSFISEKIDQGHIFRAAI